MEITMAYETKFDGRAENYLAARPAYSDELIEWLYTEMGLSSNSVIADIGCGTGKFSAQLLKRGSTVYGVEPNEGMRKKAAAAMQGYSRFRLFSGNDAHTGLQDTSVDAVTAAQAFHWFDSGIFREECNRIVRPGGRIFLIWNLRDLRYDVNQQWEAVFREFAENFIGFNNGLVEDDPRIRAFFPDGYERRAFENPLSFEREMFCRRLLSSSYAPMEGTPRYEEFLKRVNEIFDHFQQNGRIRVPHDSVVYWGR